MTKMRIV